MKQSDKYQDKYRINDKLDYIQGKPELIRPNQLQKGDIIRVKGNPAQYRVWTIKQRGNTTVVKGFELSDWTIPRTQEFKLSKNQTITRYIPT